MKNNLFPLLFFFTIIGCISNSTSPKNMQQTNPQNTFPEENKLCIENACILIEKAVTPQEHAIGLMFREKLEQNQGMLFVFPNEENRAFWMKNTFIALDIIWINADKKITGITHATPCNSNPCPLYNSIGKTKFVLEVNAGFAEKNNITPGIQTIFKE